MTERRDPNPTNADEEEVRDLLEMAGQRPELPREDFDRIRSAAHAELVRQLDPERAEVRHRGTAYRVWMTAAALLLVLALWGMWRQWTASTDQHVRTAARSDARIETIEGSIEGPDGALSAGETLPIASLLRVDGEPTAGGCSIRLSTGHSLRLRPGSAFRLLGESFVGLEAGSLYLDSGVHTRARPPVKVTTHFGEIVDIGTQFEVAIEPVVFGGEALRVRVREGRVILTPHGNVAGEKETIGVGRTLHISSDGTRSRSTIAPSAPSWTAWSALAPGIELSPGPLTALLEWFARERGLALEYGPGAASIAERTQITWFREQRPDDSELQASLAPAVPELDFSVDGEELRVTARSTDE